MRMCCRELLRLAVLAAVPLTAGSLSAQTAQPAGGAETSAAAPAGAAPAEQVQFTTPGGPLVLHDVRFEGEPVAASKLHVRQLAPGVVEVTSVAYEVGDWHLELRDSPAGIYGLGERFDTLNHAHTVVRNTSQDNGGSKGSTTYKPMPFFLSTTGYGLWLDTTGDAVFDLNAASREDLRLDLPASHLRVVIFTGADGKGRFPAILKDFTGLASGPNVGESNRAVVPPYWAFAPWQARDYHRNEREVQEDVDQTRALGLPASVILIDSPWATGYNSYQFNPKQFQDAPAMIRHLHEQAYKLVLWHTSWINLETKKPGEDGFADKIDVKSSNYDEAEREGYFVRNPDGTPWVGTWWKGRGSLIDFTNPQATRWWQQQVAQAIQAGADGFKDDDAEGNFQSSQAGGRDGDIRFADGTDPRLMRNRYGVLYNNAMEELVQRNLKGNGVLFARSVTQGANGIGFLWGGDNAASFSPDNGLPSVVLAGINAGLSGMPLWAADLGGYLAQPDTPNPLLLQRWTEFAAFTPVMEVMSTANLTPWNFDRNSPAGTTPALDTYRRFAVLHMSLFPYRYAAALKAARTGKPLLRALVLDYQDDPRARSTRDEYLFGPSLLVAPVVDENTSRPVYLPEGEWIQLFTGEKVAGPRVVVEQAAADSIPVFARRGTILPKIPEDVMTLVPPAESGNRTVHSLDTRRVYELLGEAAAEPSAITDFEGRTLVRDGDSLRIEGSAPAHIILRWRFSQPQGVSLEGKPLRLQVENGVTSAEFDYQGINTSLKWK